MKHLDPNSLTVYSRQYRSKPRYHSPGAKLRGGQLALPIEYIGWRSVNRSEAKESAGAEIRGLLGWNLGLALVSAALVLVFVFLVNYLVSEKYSLEILRQRLSRANVELELERAMVEDQASIKSLLLSAKNLGLVEAKDVDFIQGQEGSILTRNNY
ncbi:MAG: hypothetical protein HY454_04080 [Parcubacteria group bacterium]|nr:hypothetical protein [Parcubacteria group bacterium]